MPTKNPLPSLYRMFETDREMERAGMILDYGEAGQIRIARAGGANDHFAKVLEYKTRPYRRQMDAGTMDLDVADKLLMEAFAQSVVLGWEGVTDREGNEMPFTRENCIKLFTDLPDLFLDVREQAIKAANFRALELDADVKN